VAFLDNLFHVDNVLLINLNRGDTMRIPLDMVLVNRAARKYIDPCCLLVKMMNFRY